MKKSIKKFLPIFIILSVLGINLTLGLIRLENYSSVDEPYWTYGRTPKFWSAVLAHKWKSTTISDKPGITVALLSGYGLTKFNPMGYKSLRGEVKTDEQLTAINKINFYFRLPIFLCTVLLLPLFYFFLKKLFGKTIALIGFVSIGLSPILLGISLIINPDSLLWLLFPFSFLSYFIFQKTKNRRYLQSAGFFLGLTLLTKYVANILYIFFFIAPFIEYIFIEKKPNLINYLKESLKDFFVIALISMAIFYVLYPATWTHPNVLLGGTFLSKAFETTWPLFVAMIGFIVADVFFYKANATKRILDFFAQHKQKLIKIVLGIFLFLIAFALVDVYLGMKPFNFEEIIASPKGIGSGNILFKYGRAILANVYSLIFGVSPLVLFGAVCALIFALKEKNKNSFETKIIVYFILFILFYYFASTVDHVIATVRYQIVLYPLFFTISAIGIFQLISFPFLRKYFLRISASFVFCLVIVLELFSVRPFYFSYASILLPQKYLVNLKDMGDGSYEAAQFLNALPNARNLSIWSDKGAVCAVFKGKCTIGFTKKIKTMKFDYLVTSSGRKSRTLKLSASLNSYIDFHKAYSTEEYAQKIILAGRENNYVKIVSAQMLYKK
jgi:4-amino-4-deoxy-L-arabinose transferase-like glycosyltransferase